MGQNSKVVKGLGIATIVFGALGVLLALFVIVMGGALGSLMNDPTFMNEFEREWASQGGSAYDSYTAETALEMSGGVFMLFGVAGILACAYQIVVGVLALRNQENPAKGGLIMGLAIALAVLSFISGRWVSGVVAVVLAVFARKLKIEGTGAAPIYVAPGAYGQGYIDPNQQYSQGYGQAVNQYGSPAQVDAYGNPVQYDQYGNPIQYDQYGNAVQAGYVDPNVYAQQSGVQATPTAVEQGYVQPQAEQAYAPVAGQASGPVTEQAYVQQVPEQTTQGYEQPTVQGYDQYGNPIQTGYEQGAAPMAAEEPVTTTADATMMPETSVFVAPVASDPVTEFQTVAEAPVYTEEPVAVAEAVDVAEAPVAAEAGAPATPVPSAADEAFTDAEEADDPLLQAIINDDPAIIAGQDAQTPEEPQD